MATQTRELIEYEKRWEWNGYSLTERADGMWVYEQWSAIQGCRSGVRGVIEPPDGWSVEDEADMDTLDDCETKARMLIRHGREVRCLCRGYIVQ